MRKIEEHPHGFTALVESYDGNLLAVESRGSGRAIVLLHGWTMSRRFWQKQFAGLAGSFQVVAPDLRGHGDSAKALSGHTLAGYARDLKAVVEALGLADFLLVGWSMTGPLVLDYWQRFQGGGAAGLALVEMTPAPMNGAEWNAHRMKGWNLAAMHQSFAAMRENRREFTENFVNNMFQTGQAGDDLAWMTEESLKTGTEAAIAVFSDYLLRDYSGMLKEVDLPCLVIDGDSPFLSYGLAQAQWVAGQMPRARALLFENSGHLPFWEEAERFNRELATLADSLA